MRKNKNNTLTLKKLAIRARQAMLKTLIPEIVWPKYVELSGVAIPVRHMPFSFGIKLSLKNSDYELPERKLCDLFINKNMNVIELGGSLGILSTIIANKLV